MIKRDRPVFDAPLAMPKPDNCVVVAFPRATEGGIPVRRLDGYFLYQVGAAVRPLAALIHLRTSVNKGWELMRSLKEAKDHIESLPSEKLPETADFLITYKISSTATEFQTLLSAELSLADAYVVEKRGGYDITELAENGMSLFPLSLGPKIPESIRDAKQAARCIAFELPTAAAFHLHLVLERVMRLYYDVTTGNKPRPESRNIRAYVDAMKNHKVGDRKILSALSDIARFHRNPVLHPDEQLDTTEDAIALLGSIFSATMAMLKLIPDPELKLVAQDAKTKAA